MKKKSIETGYPFFYSKLPLLINLSPVFEPTPSNTPHLSVYLRPLVYSIPITKIVFQLIVKCRCIPSYFHFGKIKFSISFFRHVWLT